MDDISVMKRARQYIESLANGIDPFTGKELPDTDIVNNVRISRCLYYTSGILQKVIDNGGEVQREKLKRSERAEFSLTDEQALALKPQNAVISASKVAGIINAGIDEYKMKKLPAKALNDWLSDKGLLTEVIINGRAYTRPTPDGELLGIKLIDYITRTGAHIKICAFDPEAQQFIFDNLDAIVTFMSEKNGADNDPE